MSGIDAFHDLLADLDHPMVIVTAPGAGCLVGFSTQVSIHPARFLTCISKRNHTYVAALRAEVLAVHVLDDEDAAVAEIFGELTGDEVDKLALVNWRRGPGDVPVLDTTAGWFAGRVVDRIDLGDHTGMVLEPIAGERRRPVRQLGFQAVREMDPGHEP